MFTFKVSPDGGDPYIIKTASRDVLNWEKVSRTGSFQKFTEDINYRDMYLMAHITSKRQNMFTGTLTEFEASCDVDLEDDEDESDDVDPTRQAASTGVT